MKTTVLKFKTKKVLLGVFTTLILLIFNSCAQKVNFQTSSIVPAAEGSVKVKKDNNKNYVITIKIDDLADVERLEYSKEVYVVWMLDKNDIIKNMGQINSNKKFLSNKLKARFETVSSFEPVKIFITAENDADVRYPGRQVVLSTNSFN